MRLNPLLAIASMFGLSGGSFMVRQPPSLSRDLRDIKTYRAEGPGRRTIYTFWGGARRIRQSDFARKRMPHQGKREIARRAHQIRIREAREEWRAHEREFLRDPYRTRAELRAERARFREALRAA